MARRPITFKTRPFPISSAAPPAGARWQGFEKSGHFYPAATLVGKGYDCGLTAARCVIAMLDRNPDKSMADLKRDLPVSYGSPPPCRTILPGRGEVSVTTSLTGSSRISTRRRMRARRLPGAQLPISTRSMACRFTFADGAWGLIRASSNKPNPGGGWWKACHPPTRCARHFRRHQGRAFEPIRKSAASNQEI